MDRASFVMASAKTALMVGTIGFLIIGQLKLMGEPLWGSDPLMLYSQLVLPAPLAAAISAHMFISDRRFYERPHWLLTLAICLFAYMLYVPLFAASQLLTSTPHLSEWRAVGGWAFVVSIVPVLVVESALVCAARKEFLQTQEGGVNKVVALRHRPASAGKTRNELRRSTINP